MKNIWKWLFFILLALIVIGAIVMLFGYNMMANHGGYYGGTMMSPFGGRMFGFHDFGRTPGGFGFPFMFFPLILIVIGFKLIPLAILGLIGWGIYRLGVSNGRKTPVVPAQPAPAAPPAPETEQEVEIK